MLLVTEICSVYVLRLRAIWKTKIILMSVIVTGAAGFISSGLITYLNEKYPNTNIIAVDKFNIEKDEKSGKKSYFPIYRQG